MKIYKVIEAFSDVCSEEEFSEKINALAEQGYTVVSFNVTFTGNSRTHLFSALLKNETAAGFDFGGEESVTSFVPIHRSDLEKTGPLGEVDTLGKMSGVSQVSVEYMKSPEDTLREQVQKGLLQGIQANQRWFRGEV